MAIIGVEEIAGFERAVNITKDINTETKNRDLLIKKWIEQTEVANNSLGGKLVVRVDESNFAELQPSSWDGPDRILKEYSVILTPDKGIGYGFTREDVPVLEIYERSKNMARHATPVNDSNIPQLTSILEEKMRLIMQDLAPEKANITLSSIPVVNVN